MLAPPATLIQQQISGSITPNRFTGMAVDRVCTLSLFEPSSIRSTISNPLKWATASRMVNTICSALVSFTPFPNTSLPRELGQRNTKALHVRLMPACTDAAWVAGAAVVRAPETVPQSHVRDRAGVPPTGAQLRGQHDQACSH